VRYAGEFHPRPKYGWERWNDEWELVFNNGSGTYSPDAKVKTKHGTVEIIYEKTVIVHIINFVFVNCFYKDQ
jgi:hypothetical protein